MPIPVGLIPIVARPRTIAVDLDDTLNDFTETLRSGDFPYDQADVLSQETFEQYLQLIRNDEAEAGEYVNSAFAYCRLKIHLQCYERANARPDGIEFMHWLRDNQWRIVICTRRDMRRGYDCTKAWLQANDIPYDDLFMARNKTVFCRTWGIKHLVDDSMFNIVHGPQYGVNVYYPILAHQPDLPPNNARGFRSFREVREWIQE